MRIPNLLFTVLLLWGCQSAPEPESSKLRLWFREPASIWEAALPLGNGHLGMMPDGGIHQEKIVLNDITLWSGGEQDADNPDAGQHLPEIRKLLFEGKNDLAQELVYKTFVCKGAGSGYGRGTKVPYGSFEILGNLHLDFDADTSAVPENYNRWLSLDDATAYTTFTLNGVKHTREYFTSFSGDVGVIRLSADKKGKLSFKIRLDRPEKFETTAEGNLLTMEGQLENGTDGKGMEYQAFVGVKTRGGTVTAKNNTLVVAGATTAEMYLSAGTNYKNPGFRSQVREKLDRATASRYGSLKKSHQLVYKELFDRVELDLPVNPERELLVTPERLEAFAENPDDNGLVNLYFQYGRYLLTSSTHAGLLPPNLQGLWAKTIQTPWNGDYHLNINVQMNHWPAEITNLAELHRPLIEMTKGLTEPGSKTAKVFYNADGWVAHMMTNVWGFTAPGEHPSWGATNTGGAWLCAHLWEHYDYNRDTVYLREIYPVLRGASQFFLDMLVEEPHHGWLVTAPTTSPENAFLMPGSRKPVNICMGSTMDNQLIRELFGNTLSAAKILNADDSLVHRLAAAAAQLPPNRIGSDGRLMEWLEEYEEEDPHHRHSSHLYGLHPGNQITPDQTPDLAEAARKSLERRGDGGTGWSRAWKVNFWARLHDGDHAYTLLKNLLEPAFDTNFNYAGKGGTYPNLFCAHPPFQMDGNWGGCAGIAEMFLQSHAGFIHLIPALPGHFSEGSFKGLRARGNITVSARWKDHKLTMASFLAGSTGEIRIRIPDSTGTPKSSLNGKPTRLTPEGNFLTVTLQKGDRLEITFS
ncbi:MAG: glycoside hydrolase family 95 protein [Prolixibacteraceae bacterium]|jgi:alpha-L-fucosidase 2|nr:glycoside hydrolase family 95 protein [Prolixibacteraceae bacterium]MDI9564082.1 glycoside hydrolase family 95 protein [Bacteroidota bacterium]OQB79856.1 MAG: hypothetical protein BWX87_01854 [Bacteroidetes bacterium ADurb.Bin123]HPV18338.1 glycoside hydrolase family 95 protein [Prolixibacteraceae bacterium]